MLYHILAGVPPYTGTEEQQRAQAAAGEVKPPGEVTRGRTPPPGMQAIVMRALARDKTDRFPTVTALRDEVEQFLHRARSSHHGRASPHGTLIVREGDIADEAYVITSGRCEAFREERGRRVLLRTFGPGDVFGEGALFAASRATRAWSPSTTSPQSSSPTTISTASSAVTRGSVRSFAHSPPAIDLEARHTLTRRVVENSRIAIDIINHISRAGTWIRPGVLGATWSRLWTMLRADWQISEEQALAIVERTAELSYDAGRDEITLALLSMA